MSDNTPSVVIADVDGMAAAEKHMAAYLRTRFRSVWRSNAPVCAMISNMDFAMRWPQLRISLPIRNKATSKTPDVDRGWQGLFHQANNCS